MFESITCKDFMHAYALGKLLHFIPFTCPQISEIFDSVVHLYSALLNKKSEYVIMVGYACICFRN